MINARKIILTSLAAAFAMIASAAYAADPVYPPGSRVGIIPPDGFSVASDFVGFENADKSVKIGVAEIPEDAFTKVETALKEGKPTGTGVKAEPFKTAAGDGFITAETRKENNDSIRTYSVIAKGNKITGYIIAQIKEGAKAPSDADFRNILATASMRSDVPIDEQLSLLPFKLSEMANFKSVHTLPNRITVLLTDGGDDTAMDGAPYMVIGLVPGRMETQDERSRFAQQAATGIPGVRNMRMTSNEPLRIDGTPGFETRLEGVAGNNDTPVTVVQWIRFGSQSAIRIIGSATKDEWPKAFPRFRAVRDGIGPK